ncbi:hypothetical protein CR513_30560, partial [Mucuna pruriens]
IDLGSSRVSVQESRPGQRTPSRSVNSVVQQPNKERTNKEWPNCVIHSGIHIVYFRYFHFLALVFYAHGGARFSRLRKCKSETEKPKIVRGDRLDYQRTLVLSVLSFITCIQTPQFPTFLSETESIQLCCVCLRLAETESNKSSTDPLYDLDPEIELTLHRLRKARNIVVSNSSNFDSVSIYDNNNSATNKSGQMENNDRTLKEMATLDVVYQPWCIQYPQLELAQSYKLKSGLIHLLPKFHGLTGEDPHKHLKEFHVVCSTIRPQGIPEDYTKMKAIPFSLDGVAKDWLYLQPVLFNTWGDMKRMFLKKFFLASRTATIRKEIYGIRKQSGETLHEYWERFNKLCATCPHHQINEQLLI